MIALAGLARFALPAALAASLLGNAWLMHRLGASSERAEGEIAAAVERGRAEAAEQFAGQQKIISDKADKERETLKKQLDAIESQGIQERIVYRDRIKTLPAPECAPGQERMDAVNALIRGE